MNNKKDMGIKRFFKSFKYSIEGLIYAFRYEQNISVHLLATIIVIILGFIVKLNTIEWIMITLVIGLVIATELINTSIEAVVDLACTKINPTAKIAKDTAASAVFIFALTAIIVGLIIFVPNIIELL